MPDLSKIWTVDRCLLISIQQSRPLAVVQELEWVAIELTLPDPQDFSMSILKDRQPEGYVLKGPSLYRCTWTVFLTGQDMKNIIFCYSESVRSPVCCLRKCRTILELLLASPWYSPASLTAGATSKRGSQTLI